jgi:hypothetical protein
MSSRSIEATESVAAHLAACFDALYVTLGGLAAGFSDDSAVVFTYELARRCGEQRRRFEELSAHRAGSSTQRGEVPVIADVLVRGAREDESGALVLYAVSMVLAPRLLVSLRDGAEGAGEAEGGPLRARCQEAATMLVGEVRRIGEIAARSGPIDDDAWQASARLLEEMVDTAGFVESFGLGDS